MPDELQGYSDGLQLRRIVEEYGVGNVQLMLAALAEANRREMIERRCQEMRDNWKENIKPLTSPVKIPDSSTLRTSRESRGLHGYRGHLEEHLDRRIRKQVRDKELEDGLAVIRECPGIDEWERRELTEIVNRTIAGETARQIALALDMKLRTVERRLEELKAAVRKVN